jgi:hypothetical protein
MGEDIFDGSEEHLNMLMGLIRKVREGTGHTERMKGSVACDAPSATADVSVAPDGTVSGLKVPQTV